MRYSDLSHAVLHRHSSVSNGIMTTERRSTDFLIDGESLLRMFAEKGGLGKTDFMGCFVAGFPEANRENQDLLLLRSKPALESGRVVLYMCPECGDLACGALTVSVSRDSKAFIWQDFAYENGYEEAVLYPALGPFRFESHAYESSISEAAAL